MIDVSFRHATVFVTRFSADDELVILFCRRKHLGSCNVDLDFCRVISHSLFIFWLIHDRLEERCFSQGWEAIPIHIGKFALLSCSNSLLEGQDDENDSGWLEYVANVSGLLTKPGAKRVMSDCQ